MVTTQIWGTFARLLAGVYIIAFASLRAELIPLVGSRGISPVAEKLARVRQDMGRTGWIRYPTWLWFDASDAMLRGLPVAGILAAGFAACGVFSNLMFAVTWSIYLSIDAALGMIYPWECMLMESGFLMIFLPRLELLPSLKMAHAPEPILMFAFQWLLFRVLFGFGKMKFSRDALKDPLYLRSFLISQPIVSPLGWRAFRLPRMLLLWSHTGLFVTEIVLPFFIFFPGWPRLIPAAVFTVLMIAIQLMGNFGFFNILVIVLCIPLLDARAVTAQTWRALASPAGLAVAIVVTWSIVAGLIHLPFNTWCARGWLDWPVWGKVRGASGAVLAVLRTAMPFRTVHAYGVFPPRLGPPVRFIPVIEGTIDGKRWEPFEYKYMLSTEKSPPRFVAPHCPRIDHLMLYEGVGVGSWNLHGAVFSQGNPYDFSAVSPLDRLLERLMDPQSPAHELFSAVPFNGALPKQMRITQYVFAPSTAAEMRETGRYWHRTRIGEFLHERGPDPTVYSRWLPAPEQFHPDERWARRLVPRLRPLLDARSLETVRSVLQPHAKAAWQSFWDGFVPAARDAMLSGWSAVDALAGRLEQSYGSIALEHFDEIRGALATALVERLEPELKVRSYFHAYLAAHVLLLHGPARIEEALRSGTCVLTETESEIESRGLMVFTFLRRDMIHMHARKQRLAEQTLPLPGPPPEGLPGFGLTIAILARALPDPSEHIPVVVQDADGEWSMNGLSLL
jgi:Lipase maturation factor